MSLASAESAHVAVPTHTPRQVMLLWACLLSAPLTSLGDLQVGYVLTLFACSRAWPLLPLVSTAFFALWTGAAVWYAHGFDWRGHATTTVRSPEQPQPPTMGWVALTAIGLHVISLLVIAAMAIPRIALNPCWR